MSSYTKHRKQKTTGGKGVLIGAALVAFVLVAVSVWAVDDYRHDGRMRQKKAELELIEARQRDTGRSFDLLNERMRDAKVEHRGYAQDYIKAVEKLSASPLAKEIEKDIREQQEMRAAWERKWK